MYMNNIRSMSNNEKISFFIEIIFMFRSQIKNINTSILPVDSVVLGPQTLSHLAVLPGEAVLQGK